jgi:hypothetical protein
MSGNGRTGKAKETQRKLTRNSYGVLHEKIPGGGSKPTPVGPARRKVGDNGLDALGIPNTTTHRGKHSSPRKK